MEAENSEKWDISICGLNCAKCDIFQAGHGNEKLRDEIIEWFRKEHNRALKPEQASCDGCRGSLETHWSSDCKMMQCAKKRDIQYCFQCRDFPCTVLEEFSSDGISHHKRTVKNLERMKGVGIDAWIEEQGRKGKCVFCP